MQVLPKSKYKAEYKKCVRKGWKQNEYHRPSSPHCKSGKRESNRSATLVMACKRRIFLSSFLLAFSSSVNANYQVKGQTNEVKQAD